MLVQTATYRKEEHTEIVRQIYEIISVVLTIYETAQVDGILPPSILYDIGQFTEYVTQPEF
jgi:hypothetical protein